MPKKKTGPLNPARHGDRLNIRIDLASGLRIGPGKVAVLEEIARSVTDDVWIVAPHEEQSGKARAVTLTDPVRVRQEGEKRYAVAGTPADAVLLGVMDILKDHRPDLVLSGVNRGQNIAEDTSQSGTVAAAIEGAFLRRIGISLGSR